MFSLDLPCKQEDQDIFSAELWEHGSLGIVELDGILRAFFADDADIHWLSKDFPDVAATRADDRDWVAHARERLQPMLVGERFFLVPEWRNDPTPDGRLRISINAGMAFGTGAHETTRLCLELLERHCQPGITVGDIGTGSGILAEAAHLLQARTVVACDVDPVAVAVAAKNFSAAARGVHCFIGSADSIAAASLDLVVANITPDWLIRLAPEWQRMARPGGTAILSGIEAHDVDSVTAALTSTGAIVTAVRAENEWRALTVRFP